MTGHDQVVLSLHDRGFILHLGLGSLHPPPRWFSSHDNIGAVNSCTVFHTEKLKN